MDLQGSLEQCFLISKGLRLVGTVWTHEDQDVGTVLLATVDTDELGR